MAISGMVVNAVCSKCGKADKATESLPVGTRVQRLQDSGWMANIDTVYLLCPACVKAYEELKRNKESTTGHIANPLLVMRAFINDTTPINPAVSAPATKGDKI